VSGYSCFVPPLLSDSSRTYQGIIDACLPDFGQFRRRFLPDFFLGGTYKLYVTHFIRGLVPQINPGVASVPDLSAGYGNITGENRATY
jgi:hypothetical protein